MTVHYAAQQVGVADGTVPASRADGRQVNARRRVHLASKVPGTAWLAADTFYAMKKPAGQKIIDIKIDSDTSLGASTIAVGTLAVPDKYVAARTFTTPLDAPTSIGPKASTLDDDPGAEEDIYVTIAAATIVAGTLLTFIFELSGQ